MKNLINIYFKTLSLVSSRLAGKQAFQLFQKTRKAKTKQKEVDFFESARQFKVAHYLENIDCYELGNPDGKIVLLVHGWNSNAGSMGGIGMDLVKKGYHVYAFNLPAHGFSKRKKTNMKVCKEAFIAVLEHISPTKSISIVAHSFGSAVTTFSLGNSDYKVDKLVFLTNPNKLSVIFEQFSEYIGLSKTGLEVMSQYASDIIEEDIKDVNIELYSNKVKYNEMLLIHDYHDKILPYQNSVDVRSTWKRSKMVTFHKIGHYRMLWNDEVIASVVDFLETKTVKLKNYDDPTLESLAS